MNHPIGPGGFAGELAPLEALLRAKARGEEADFSAFLTTIQHDDFVPGTRCTGHTHYLALDPTGIPRARDLVRFLATKIVDYAIPRAELEEAHNYYISTGSSRLFSRLDQEARSLFTDVVSSGELGELLLFTLTETLLRLPRILCKMSLKTSSRMHVHGSDAIHAGIENGRLALYWGESKLHGSFADATRSAIADLGKLLTFSTREPNLFRRDLLLIQRQIDVGDETLADCLLEYLNPDGVKFNTIEYRGIALIGFDYKKYPSNPMVLDNDSLRETVVESISGWRSAIGKRVIDEALDRFHIHVFCIPFPSVELFRQFFRAELGL